MTISHARTRLLGLTLAIAATSLAGPAIQGAQAKDNKGSGSQVTCEGHGGGTPGDTITVTTTITVNGKPAYDYSMQEICGNDGQWHIVGKLVAQPTGPIQVATTQVALQSALVR